MLAHFFFSEFFLWDLRCHGYDCCLVAFEDNCFRVHCHAAMLAFIFCSCVAGYFHHFSLFREFDDYQPKDVQLYVNTSTISLPTADLLFTSFRVLAYVGTGRN
jgi:hypothetical protein